MEFNLWFLAIHLWRSIVLSGTATITSLIIGCGLAWLEHKQQTAPPDWFLALCTTVLFLPPLYIAVGAITLLGTNGYMNILLNWFQLPKLYLLYSPWVVILAYCYYNIPLAYLAGRSLLARWPTHYETSALIAGASRYQVRKTITWPQLRRPLLQIGGIIFIYCQMSFLLPLLLGGIRYATLEVYTYELITQYHNVVAAGIVAGLQLLLLGSIVFITQRSGQFLIRGVAVSPSPIRWRWWHILSTIILLSPMISVANKSNFSDLAQTKLWPAFAQSFVLSLVVLILVLIIIQIRYVAQFSWIWLTLSPVTMSFIWLSWIGPGFWSAALALTCTVLPIAGYFYHMAWLQRPEHFLHTAAILGATRWQQWKLHIQWIGPTWLQISGVTIAVVMGDATITTLLLSPQHSTAMARSFQLMSSYHGAAAAAGMTITTSIILGSIILSHYVTRYYKS